SAGRRARRLIGVACSPRRGVDSARGHKHDASPRRLTAIGIGVIEGSTFNPPPSRIVMTGSGGCDRAGPGAPDSLLAPAPPSPPPPPPRPLRAPPLRVGVAFLLSGPGRLGPGAPGWAAPAYRAPPKPVKPPPRAFPLAAPPPRQYLRWLGGALVGDFGLDFR